MRAEGCQFLLLLHSLQHFINGGNPQFNFFQTADAQCRHACGHGGLSDLIAGSPRLDEFSDLSTDDHAFIDDRSALHSQVTAFWAARSSVKGKRKGFVVEAQTTQQFRIGDILFFAILANFSNQSLGNHPYDR